VVGNFRKAILDIRITEIRDEPIKFTRHIDTLIKRTAIPARRRHLNHGTSIISIFYCDRP